MHRPAGKVPSSVAGPRMARVAPAAAPACRVTSARRVLIGLLLARRMKWPLAALAALLALAAAAPLPVAGADMTEHGFAGPAHLRAAYGDIPLTQTVEPDGRWNVVQYVRMEHSGGQSVTVGFNVPPGFVVDDPSCTCGNVTLTGFEVTTQQDPGAGTHVFALAMHTPPNGAPAAVPLLYQPSVSPWTATIYTRQGQTVSSTVAETTTLPGADRPEYTIHAFGPASGVGYFGLNLPPTATTTTAPPEGTSPWLYAAAGLLVGAALWALLVARGMVQRRTRKQVAAPAAHVEAAKAEPVTVLEGRKRALMAALKEVELARQADEMDIPTYDALKAELKKEAVTVMRAIDETKGSKA